MLTPNNTVPIIAHTHPLRSDRAEYIGRAGASLTELVLEAGLDPILLDAPAIRIFVDDMPVPRAQWSTCRPSIGQLVTVAVVPTGGEGGKDILRVVATIAVLVISVWAGGGFGAAGLFGEGMAAANTAAAIGISLVGNLLIHALIPPQPSSFQAESERGNTYSISGMQNRIDPYGVPPKLFGEHRVYPPYAALPYTEVVGDDQYLRCLFDVGYDPMELSDFRLGNTPLEEIGIQGIDYELEVYKSDEYIDAPDEVNHYSIYPYDVYEDTEFTPKLLQNVSHIRQTATDIDQIDLEFIFPSGLVWLNANTYKETGAQLEISYKSSTASTYTIYTAVRTAYFGATGYIFADYDSELSAPAGLAVGWQVEGLTSGATGRVEWIHIIEVELLTGYYTRWGDPEYISKKSVQQVLFSQLTGDAFVSGETLRFGGSLDLETDWIINTPPSATADNLVYLTGKSFSALRRNIKIHVPRETYSVRVRRVDQFYLNGSVTADCIWGILRSTTYEPPVTIPNRILIGLKIKATDKLSGHVDQFNCFAKAQVWIYDQDLPAWKAVFTRNPAHAYFSALTDNKANKRPLTIDRVDLDTIDAWATNCSTAERHFDAYIDFRKPLLEILRDIAVTGRASFGMRDNKFSIVEDLPQSTPKAYITARNSWGYKGRRTFTELPHALRCRFVNSDKDYQADEILVYDDWFDSYAYGSTVKATKFETMDFWGVVESTNVAKIARYMIAVGRLRSEIHEVYQDVENLRCTRGDLVFLSHDVPLISYGSARIKSVTTDGGGNVTACTLDEYFTMSSGTPGEYSMRIWMADGTDVIAVVVSQIGTFNSFTFTPAIPVATAPDIGNVAVFGETGNVMTACILSKIEPGPDLSAKLTLLPYNSAIYTADETLPDWVSNITVPPKANRIPPTPVIDNVETVNEPPARNDDGSYDIFVSISWQPSAFEDSFDSTLRSEITGYEIQYRVNSTGDEIVLNGGFEATTNNWVAQGSPDFYEPRTDVKHSGIYSLKFGASAEITGIKQVNIPFTKNREYRFSGWMYPDGTNEFAAHASDGITTFYPPAGMPGSAGDDWVGSQRWHHISFNFTPSTTTTVGYSFISTDAGESSSGASCYVDDISIKEVITYGTWETIQTLPPTARTASVALSEDADVDLRVRAIGSSPGQYSDWATEDSLQVVFNRIYPPDVENLRVSGAVPIGEGEPTGEGELPTDFAAKDCSVIWTAAVNEQLYAPTIDYYRVEVRRSTDDYLLRVENVVTNQFIYSYDQNKEDNGTPLRQLKIYVWAHNTHGLLSQNAAVLLASNPAPDMSNITPVVAGGYASLQITWVPVDDADMSYYNIYADTISSPATSPTNLVAVKNHPNTFAEVLSVDYETTYYVKIVPYDSFGIGVASLVGEGTPEQIPEVNITAELFGSLTITDSQNNNDETKARFYDGDKYTAGVYYNTSNWEWIAYSYKLYNYFDRVGLWFQTTPVNQNLAVCVSYSDDNGSTWNWLKGETNHELDSEGRLLIASDSSDAYTNFWSAYAPYDIALFPNNVVANVVRIHFWAVQNTIYEFIPDRILIGELAAIGELSAISANIGTITSGSLVSENWATNDGMKIDLDNKLISMRGAALNFESSAGINFLTGTDITLESDSISSNNPGLIKFDLDIDTGSICLGGYSDTSSLDIYSSNAVYTEAQGQLHIGAHEESSSPSNNNRKPFERISLYSREIDIYGYTPAGTNQSGRIYMNPTGYLLFESRMNSNNMGWLRMNGGQLVLSDFLGGYTDANIYFLPEILGAGESYIGNATYPWDNIYADTVYYATLDASPWDTVDDLAVLEKVDTGEGLYTDTDGKQKVNLNIYPDRITNKHKLVKKLKEENPEITKAEIEDLFSDPAKRARELKYDIGQYTMFLEGAIRQQHRKFKQFKNQYDQFENQIKRFRRNLVSIHPWAQANNAGHAIHSHTVTVTPTFTGPSRSMKKSSHNSTHGQEADNINLTTS